MEKVLLALFVPLETSSRCGESGSYSPLWIDWDRRRRRISFLPLQSGTFRFYHLDSRMHVFQKDKKTDQVEVFHHRACFPPIGLFPGLHEGRRTSDNARSEDYNIYMYKMPYKNWKMAFIPRAAPPREKRPF